MNITQPTLSHRMKILCDRGIVEGRKDGKWTYCSISKTGVAAARQYLDGLTNAESKKELAGAVLLGDASGTAMVFVWSTLTKS